MHLETERLIIQKFGWDDFSTFAALMGNIEVRRFSLKGPLTLEEARQNFQERILIEFAYRFSSTFWGQGRAYEASLAIRDHAISELKISCLISIIDPQNDRSQKLARRLRLDIEKKTQLRGNIYVQSAP